MWASCLATLGRRERERRKRVSSCNLLVLPFPYRALHILCFRYESEQRIESERKSCRRRLVLPLAFFLFFAECHEERKVFFHLYNAMEIEWVDRHHSEKKEKMMRLLWKSGVVASWWNYGFLALSPCSHLCILSCMHVLRCLRGKTD